jgi:hypothetical protein
MPMPDWAQRLVETGEHPEPDTPAGDEFFGWAFCQERVPGLPPAIAVVGWPETRRKARLTEAPHQAPAGQGTITRGHLTALAGELPSLRLKS